MDPVTAIDTILTATGNAGFIPVVAAGATLVSAVVGLASIVSTKYPPTWKGATTIHKIALLVGNAAPATPATTSANPPPAV